MRNSPYSKGFMLPLEMHWSLVFVADEDLQSSIGRLDLSSRVKSGKYDPLMAKLDGGFTWYCFSV